MAEPAFDGRLPPPQFVSIETTKFCNLRCRMCVQFNDGTTVSGPHMQIDEFERIASAVLPHVERWQPSVSGEPTMAKDFDHMLDIAERFGVKAEMFTNGTLLNEQMIARLAPNLGTLTVSFDGATADTFEFIRVGAGFDDVKQKIRRLIQYCRQHLPADLQPQFGMNCTLMERNIRELPALVTLAVQELDVDFVSCFHVFPVTEEMKLQSLVHHRGLARRCIDEAFSVAARLGVGLRVDALDQITAASALQPGEQRALATVDGVVEGLELREVTGARRRPWPRLDERHPDHAGIQSRRRAAAVGFPAVRPPVADAPDRGPIWWCDFLWHKTYVAIGGAVKPCCVHGVPDVGNLLQQPFAEVWNNDAYRAMRQRMVMQQPVPCCRGCLHIRRIDDPAQVDQYLRGMRVPRPDELEPLPAVLDPRHERPHRSGPPPVLEWVAVPGARQYEVQFSLDCFASILFTTAGPQGGPAVRDNRYEVPKWAWRYAPVDREISYRVLARLPAGEREVVRGSVPAEPGVR